MDDDVRERLAERLGETAIAVSLPDGRYEADWVLGRVNARAILAEIGAAGFVAVDRERFERLRLNAWAYRENRERWYADQDVCVHPGKLYELQPGDLEPVGGAG